MPYERRESHESASSRLTADEIGLDGIHQGITIEIPVAAFHSRHLEVTNPSTVSRRM